MGGYDLYGNWYSNEQDAYNAEMAQCAEITASHNAKKLEEQKQEADYLIDILHGWVKALESRVTKLEKRLDTCGG